MIVFPAAFGKTLILQTVELCEKMAGLDEARMSFGTDEDLLLISRTTPDPRVVDRVLGQD